MVLERRSISRTGQPEGLVPVALALKRELARQGAVSINQAAQPGRGPGLAGLLLARARAKTAELSVSPVARPKQVRASMVVLTARALAHEAKRPASLVEPLALVRVRGARPLAQERARAADSTPMERATVPLVSQAGPRARVAQLAV